MIQELFMDKEKHLELIENVISRMGNCSFVIKGWVITIIAAVFGLAAKDSDIKFIIIAYVIIPCFWFLDAFYLSKEKQYRDLYDKFRLSKKTKFSMELDEFNKEKNTWCNCIFSKTLMLFYIPLIILISILMYIFTKI